MLAPGETWEHLPPGASHTAEAQEAQGRAPEAGMQPALPSLSVRGGFLVAATQDRSLRSGMYHF